MGCWRRSTKSSEHMVVFIGRALTANTDAVSARRSPVSALCYLSPATATPFASRLLLYQQHPARLSRPRPASMLYQTAFRGQHPAPLSPGGWMQQHVAELICCHLSLVDMETTVKYALLFVLIRPMTNCIFNVHLYCTVSQSCLHSAASHSARGSKHAAGSDSGYN